MVVNTCPSMVALTVEGTSGAMLCEAMAVEVSQSNLDTSAGRLFRSPVEICRVMFVRRIFSLGVVEEAIVLGEGCGSHPQNSCHIPAGAGDKPDDRFGTDDVSSCDPNEILVAAHGSP